MAMAAGRSKIFVGPHWRIDPDSYGIVPTFQHAHFGRVYATYGGFFIALSLFWGWFVDRNVPDRFDLIGAAISLAGVAVIMYWPR